jgi:hypothetical protein
MRFRFFLLSFLIALIIFFARSESLYSLIYFKFNAFSQFIFNNFYILLNILTCINPLQGLCLLGGWSELATGSMIDSTDRLKLAALKHSGGLTVPQSKILQAKPKCAQKTNPLPLEDMQLLKTIIIF